MIVHLASAETIDDWASEVPDEARVLTDRFWPGPLTVILRRSARVLDEVTGGLATVGLRVPAAPVALDLLAAFGGGLAAPSANRFGHVSPTTAQAVIDELGDAVDLVLDGGPCRVGVESTIVELDGRGADGAATRCGHRCRSWNVHSADRSVLRKARAGRLECLPSHYAPNAAVEIVAAEALAARTEELRQQGRRVVTIVPSADLDTDAHTLYARLREADAHGADVILAVLPEDEGIGAAIADRLRKAAGPRG